MIAADDMDADHWAAIGYSDGTMLPGGYGFAIMGHDVQYSNPQIQVPLERSFRPSRFENAGAAVLLLSYC